MINRQNNWLFRIEAEHKSSDNAHFVTLTYNNENVPQKVNQDTGEIINTLDYQDVQKYMKRLRKGSKKPIKHYTVGEYGEENQRPHYHQIIFNAEEENIKKTWDKGFSLVGTVTAASIRYVTKYMGKRISNTPDGAEKPKNVMSQGIGKSYLKNENILHHKENLIDTLTNEGGNKIALPRYYKDKIFSNEEKRTLNIINKVKSNADLKHLQDSCVSHEKFDFEISTRIREKEARARSLERRKHKHSKSKDT